MRSAACSLCALLAVFVAACATYREDLNRGQRMYEKNRYENALAIWRVLENDSDALSPMDQARYAYFRGMTDYRLGFRADARHWLAIAQATEESAPGGLRADWIERLNQSLTDLNGDVYGSGAPPDRTDSSARTLPTGASESEAKTSPPVPTAPPLRPEEGCAGDAECPTGQRCEGASCVPR